MPQFQKTTKRSSVLESPIALVFLLGLCVLLGYSVVSIGIKTSEAVHNEKLAKKEYQAEKDKQISLEANLERLNTPAGEEEAIRNTYRVSKEGEGLVVIVDDSKNQKTTETDTTSHGFWVRVKAWFGK